MEFEAAGAGVHPDGQPAAATCDHILDHAERRVVHRLITQVFKRMQDGGLAGARQAGHQHDTLAFAARSCRERPGDLDMFMYTLVQRIADDFIRRATSLHFAAEIDVPHVAWTRATQREGLRAWKEFPSVHEVFELIMPPVRGLVGRVRSLRVISGIIQQSH